MKKNVFLLVLSALLLLCLASCADHSFTITLHDLGMDKDSSVLEFSDKEYSNFMDICQDEIILTVYCNNFHATYNPATMMTDTVLKRTNSEEMFILYSDYECTQTVPFISTGFVGGNAYDFYFNSNCPLD